jgi:hypothetical protein
VSLEKGALPVAMNDAESPVPNDYPEDARPDPCDLVVRLRTKSAEQHLSRGRVHDCAKDDWVEAVRVIQEDIEKAKRNGS